MVFVLIWKNTDLLGLRLVIFQAFHTIFFSNLFALSILAECRDGNEHPALLDEQLKSIMTGRVPSLNIYI